LKFQLWILVLLLSVPLSLRADTVYISSTGTGSGVPSPNAKIKNVADGQLTYTAFSGNDVSKPLDQVVRIEVDNEPALNAAEQAFVDQKWNAAVDGYIKVARATNKPWLKDWATVRLLTAAQKSNRFDAASTAYIGMLLRDPAAAAKYKPQFPDASSSYLDGAITEATNALGTNDITDRQKLGLLNYLSDLYTAKKDSAGQDRIQQQIDEILAKDPSNPAAGQAIARRALTNAQRALDSKDYARAVSEIDTAKTRFIDLSQQADALFILAEAKYAQAAAKRDANDLRDAALAYMRVVANFKDAPNHPHVVESLLKTATIEEQLGDPAAAQLLYQQIVQQYPEDPAAAVAKQKTQK
jgi:TolA-binding protein